MQFSPPPAVVPRTLSLDVHLTWQPFSKSFRAGRGHKRLSTDWSASINLSAPFQPAAMPCASTPVNLAASIVHSSFLYALPMTKKGEKATFRAIYFHFFSVSRPGWELFFRPAFKCQKIYFIFYQSRACLNPSLQYCNFKTGRRT